MKKNESAYKRLVNDLEKGFNKPDQDIIPQITKDFLETQDYLHYVLKEGMRIDSPSPASFGFLVSEDISICGVPIPKGSATFIGTHGVHVDPSEWKEPEKFIPERFDPESDYFLTPSKNKARSPNTFGAFGVGQRSCGGKSVAMLELKGLLTYFLTTFEYELDQEQVDNKHISFCFGSQFKLKAKITKKKR